MESILMPYKRGFSYTYACGSYAAREALSARPDAVRAVYAHPDFRDDGGLCELCSAHSVPYIPGERAFRRINRGENTYVAAVVDKYRIALRGDCPHIVLDGVGDCGNLGTIARIAAALNTPDIALIAPMADIWHPKTIRASMGALFRVRFACYESAETYRSSHPRHELFAFMLNGDTELRSDTCPSAALYSLVFGNEWTGLDDGWRSVATSVRIPQSAQVDSLNLAIAVGIGAYVFGRG